MSKKVNNRINNFLQKLLKKQFMNEKLDKFQF